MACLLEKRYAAVHEAIDELLADWSVQLIWKAYPAFSALALTKSGDDAISNKSPTPPLPHDTKKRIQ